MPKQRWVDHVFATLKTRLHLRLKLQQSSTIVDASNGLDWDERFVVRVNDVAQVVFKTLTIVEGAGRNLDTILCQSH